MDKKIGIMSMQRIINYGSFLQAYGLKKMIESISKSEVEFVDYKFGIDITDRLKKAQTRTESVMHKVLKNRTPWNYLKKMQFFKEIERRLIQDLKAMGVDELNYDCMVDTLVIGSDEVFNCLQPYPVGYSKQLFGDGYEGDKLVSYAASFGSTRYEDLIETGIVQEIKIMLSKFAAISVRDENSAHIVKQLLGYDPEIHMDPVLMYDFAQEIAEYKINEKDYIILLPLDEKGENEDGEVWIYGYKEDESDPNAEPELFFIEDEDEYDAVSDAFDEYLDQVEFDELIDESSKGSR